MPDIPENPSVMNREFLTTGQAATLCSVTPDAVLKWIKAGKLPAHRTPGGHYRIRRSELREYISAMGSASPPEYDSRPFQYCWEFNSKNGEVLEGCDKCLVYQAKAFRCYEMSQLPEGHSKSFCSISCEECDYYKLVSQQKANILFVTDKAALRESLELNADEATFNLQFTDCEYNCSMLIENYRPDYVHIDCSLGKERSLDFARQLKLDPRIPFVRIILVGKRHELPTECDKEIFALIESPISLNLMKDMIDNLDKININPSGDKYILTN
jgi:excisionase family DNA binding protein